MTPSEIEPATLRLNQQCHYVLPVKFKCSLTAHILSEHTLNVRGNVEYFFKLMNFTIWLVSSRP